MGFDTHGSVQGMPPFACSKTKSTRVVLFCFGEHREPTRVEGGAVLREQNALPCGIWITVNLTAKDDIDNVGAGRVAR